MHVLVLPARPAMEDWLTKPPGLRCAAGSVRLLISSGYIAGCEMTPDSQLLLCTCGDHSARLHETKSEWQVFAVKKKGNKPQIVTTRATKVKAAAVVRDLCAGLYTKKNKSRAAPGTTSDACTRPVRKRKLSSSDTAATTSATKPAGPGRGHKGPQWDDAVTAAERVLQKRNASNVELRYALKRTVKECKSLQKMCDAVSIEG